MQKGFSAHCLFYVLKEEKVLVVTANKLLNKRLIKRTIKVMSSPLLSQKRDKLSRLPAGRQVLLHLRQISNGHTAIAPLPVTIISAPG